MIPLLLPLFFSVSIAADPKTGNCMHLDTFHHFNASITTTIPALRFSDPDELLVQSDESWLLTQRVNRGDGPGIGPWAANRFFINTNSSKTDNPDMGICTEGLRIFDTNDAGIYIWPSTFMFSRKVMERSLEDKGDCKTMLGEACVEALKRHYVNEGRQYMEKGGCASEDDDLAGLSDVQWNRTIPEECRSLQNELEEWPWTSWGKSVLFAYDNIYRPGNLTHGIEDLWTDYNCETINWLPELDEDQRRQFNNSLKVAGGALGSWEHSVRFPVPTFFTIYPMNSSSKATPHVEIKCLIPELRKGQEDNNDIPTAQELMDDENIIWSENATDPSAPVTTTTRRATPAPTGGADSAKVAPIVGIAGILAFLLW